MLVKVHWEAGIGVNVFAECIRMSCSWRSSKQSTFVPALVLKV